MRGRRRAKIVEKHGYLICEACIRVAEREKERGYADEIGLVGSLAMAFAFCTVIILAICSLLVLLGAPKEVFWAFGALLVIILIVEAKDIYVALFPNH